MSILIKTKKEKNELIESCILSLSNDNPSGLDNLYELIKTDIYAYALSKVCNKYDAEDIMQDTFLQIYKNAKLYTPQGKPLAWILTIETNLINRYYQLKSRTISLDENLSSNQIANNLIDRKEINNDFIKRLLNILKEDEREIISLHIVSGLKFREIAKLLNKPLSTILSKYNRAIKKLQRKNKGGS